MGGKLIDDIMKDFSDKTLTNIVAILVLILVGLFLGYYIFTSRTTTRTDISSQKSTDKKVRTIRTNETDESPDTDTTGNGGSRDDGGYGSTEQMVLRDDHAGTSQNMAVTIDVLSNDTFRLDVADYSTMVIVQSPKHGTAEVQTDGAVKYTPDDGYAGTDTFTYKLCEDPETNSKCHTATVAIQINESDTDTENTDSGEEHTTVTEVGASFTGATASDGVFINKYAYSYENHSLVFMWGVRGSEDPVYPSYTSGYTDDGDFVITFPSLKKDLVVSNIGDSPVDLGNLLPDLYYTRTGDKSEYRFDVNDTKQDKEPTIERTIDPDDNKPVIKLTLPL